MPDLSILAGRIITFAFFILSFSVFLETRAQVRKSKTARASETSRVSRIDRGGSVRGIPLEIDNNLILMQVSVNGSKTLRFIFDTGASISAIDSKRAAELGLKTEGQFRGDATGGRVEGATIKYVELSVQGATVSNLTIASMPFQFPPGFEFDGVLGCDFIKHFVIEIDYQQKVMNLFDPHTYSYDGKGAVIPLLLKPGKTPLAHVEIFLERLPALAANLEVDTGGDGTFIINSPFVAKHKLVAAIVKTNEATNRGAGGEQKLIFGQVKKVRLGQIILRDPPVGLSLDTEGAGASTENDGLIGGEIFRRFKLILDYSRKRMMLEKNNSFNEPYHIEPDDD